MKCCLRDGLILTLLVVATVLSRLHTYHETLDWDVATYAVIGHEINSGKSLYSDAWDIKPPGIFIAYAVAERLVGYGIQQPYLLSVATTGIAILAIYFALLETGSAAAIIAAAAFTILSGDMLLEANRPNTEAFINAALAVAIAIWIRWRRVIPFRAALGAGAAFAIASFFKQTAVIASIEFCFVALIIFPKQFRLRDASIIFAIIALLWLGAFGYFAMTNRGWLFWMTSVVSPRAYGGGQTLFAAFSPSHLAPPELAALSVAFVLSAVAFIAGSIRIKITCAIIAIATQIQIALPGHYFPHYYQFWLLPLSLGSGFGAHALLTSNQITSKHLKRLAVGTAILAMLTPQAWSQTLPASQWAYRQYGYYHSQLQPIALQFNTLLHPDETFFNWNDEAWIYFVTGRSPIGPGIWRSAMIHPPLGNFLSTQTLARLQKSPPRYVLIWAFNEPDFDNPIDKWIADNYRPVDDGVNRHPLRLLRRID